MPVPRPQGGEPLPPPCDRALERRLTAFASVNDPVLLLGPPGSGKSVLAAELHCRSGRSGPYRDVSTAELADSLAQSLLFGHSSGAFTGARESREGFVESAHRGTLFIDELGDASPLVQVLLLKVLTEGKVCRVGETRSRPVDVRIIAATNRDLVAGARDGVFRQDLLDRFGYFVFHLRPLCERPEEILPFARLFLAGKVAAERWEGMPVLSSAAESHLLRHNWPGNLRELRSACHFALAFARPHLHIDLEHLPPEILGGRADRGLAGAFDWSGLDDLLRRFDGSVTRTAKHLQCSRQTIYRHLDARRRGGERRAL